MTNGSRKLSDRVLTGAASGSASVGTSSPGCLACDSTGRVAASLSGVDDLESWAGRGGDGGTDSSGIEGALATGGETVGPEL